MDQDIHQHLHLKHTEQHMRWSVTDQGRMDNDRHASRTTLHMEGNNHLYTQRWVWVYTWGCCSTTARTPRHSTGTKESTIYFCGRYLRFFAYKKIYLKVIISEALSTHVHLHGRTRPLHLRSRLWRLQWECPSTTASTVYLGRTTAFRLWPTCSRTVVSTWKQRTATLSRSKFRSIRSIPTWRRTQRVCLVGTTCPLLFLLTKGYYWASTGST